MNFFKWLSDEGAIEQDSNIIHADRAFHGEFSIALVRKKSKA